LCGATPFEFSFLALRPTAKFAILTFNCGYAILAITKELGAQSVDISIVFKKVKDSNKMTGTIKKLVSDRGFGFIAIEGEAKDLFFHSESLVGVTFPELREGDAVSFEKADSDKGPKAVDVKRA
jgi:CspA family cold shock protein